MATRLTPRAWAAVSLRWGEEGGIGGDQVGLAAQEFLMHGDRWQQQIAVAGTLR